MWFSGHSRISLIPFGYLFGFLFCSIFLADCTFIQQFPVGISRTSSCLTHKTGGCQFDSYQNRGFRFEVLYLRRTDGRIFTYPCVRLNNRFKALLLAKTHFTRRQTNFKEELTHRYHPFAEILREVSPSLFYTFISGCSKR